MIVNSYGLDHSPIPCHSTSVAATRPYLKSLPVSHCVPYGRAGAVVGIVGPRCALPKIRSDPRFCFKITIKIPTTYNHHQSSHHRKEPHEFALELQVSENMGTFRSSLAVARQVSEPWARRRSQSRCQAMDCTWGISQSQPSGNPCLNGLNHYGTDIFRVLNIAHWTGPGAGTRFLRHWHSFAAALWANLASISRRNLRWNSWMMLDV
jgi:hypothetical protein